jgi:hypothetical protein
MKEYRTRRSEQEERGSEVNNASVQITSNTQKNAKKTRTFTTDH